MILTLRVESEAAGQGSTITHMRGADMCYSSVKHTLSPSTTDLPSQV